MVVCYVFLVQFLEDIRLIFVCIYCFVYIVLFVEFIELGVVFGSNEFVVQCICLFQQGILFDVGIVKDIGIGGVFCQVFVYKIVDNIIIEFIVYIDNKVVEVYFYSYFLGIVDGIQVIVVCFFGRFIGIGVILGFYGDFNNFIVYIVYYYSCDCVVNVFVYGY